MKEEYKDAELEIIALDTDDIVITSPGDETESMKPQTNKMVTPKP